MESITAASCNAWPGTGIVWTIEAGIPGSRAFGQKTPAGERRGGLSFAQISDSHIGFNKPASPDVTATLRTAIDKIGAPGNQPEFLLHTGDLTHTAQSRRNSTVFRTGLDIRLNGFSASPHATGG